MSNPESDILHSWVAYTDPNSGQIFYYNTITQASQWDKPEGFEGSIEEGVEIVTVREIIEYLRSQPEDIEIELENAKKKQHDLKQRIIRQVRDNYSLEHELDAIGEKIGLLIRNRITTEEVMAAHRKVIRDDSCTNHESKTGDHIETWITREKRDLYGKLLHLLQSQPEYLARVTPQVHGAEIPDFLQTVVLTLFGDQYDSREERLLLSLFRMVLVEEFETSGSDMGSFMRGNTAFTQMLSAYTKRPHSLEYLRETVGVLVEQILNSHETNSLELGPIQICNDLINRYETETGQTSPIPRGLSEEEIILRDDVIQEAQSRAERLIHLAGLFLERIYSSVENVPYGIRWMCKQLAVLGREAFPTAADEQIDSLVGGFINLRYINPAIVTPDGLNIVRKKIGKQERKILTSITRVLQNVSNGTHMKEKFTQTINQWIDQQISSMAQFFQQVTDVEDLDDSLIVDRILEHVYTKDKGLTVTYNELVMMHSLLHRNIDIVAPRKNDPIRSLLDSLCIPPPPLPRSDNYSLTISLVDSKSNTQRILSIDEISDSTAELLFRETKTNLATVLRKMPSDLVVSDYMTLVEVLECSMQRAVNDEDFAQAQRIKRVMIKLAELAEVQGLLIDGTADIRTGRGVNSEDIYAPLLAEFYKDCLQLAKQYERVQSQQQRLDNAMQLVHDHKNYLEEKLEFYREYLRSVRQNMATGRLDAGVSGLSSSGGRRIFGFGRRERRNMHKFKHSELEQLGVIQSSSISESIRKQVTFTFSSSMPGEFEITAEFKGVEAATATILFEELLERQEKSETLLEMDQVFLNVNKLIHLLNSRFLLT